MNERESDREVHDDQVDELKALKPRAPQLNWDAISSAHGAEDSTRLQSLSVPVASPARIRPAVAWWSGLAAGATITFFALQWLVVSDLRAQLQQHKQTASVKSTNSTKLPDTVERQILETESVVDIHALLDRPSLSVGSYRVCADRLVYSTVDSIRTDRPQRPSSNNPSQSTDADARSVENFEVSQSESSANRLLLLRELQRVVY